MNRLLRARVPEIVLRIFGGVLITACIATCVFVTRPDIDIRLGILQSEARSALPVGSTRDLVTSWLEAHGLQFIAVYDKGGDRFLRYIMRMKQGSSMRPSAEF